ncbi:MAG: metallophosphoesterase, partial [Pseudomonadota bacterium]|nr:metallophosphoesterase [Pseudomonadota bacterium]
ASTGRDALAGHGALAVSAGTATSTRGRGEENSFNALRVTKQRIELERYAWHDAQREFLSAGTQVFVRVESGWRREG